MKSSVTAKLTQLINDEAMKQLAENYHELLPKLIKVDVDHIEEDLSYAVGAAYFMLSGRVIFAPIIYREGKVDSISYIGDTENETLYGLTKRMYKRLISSTKAEFGKALSEKEQERLMIDKGIIGRLFATPQTISPKVAGDEDYSDNMIISMLENPVFAKSFEKLASMPEYRKVLEKAYSNRVFNKLAAVLSMTKLAHIDREEDGSMIFHKIADLNSLPKQKRGEAAMAIAKEGFYKVAEDKTPQKAVFYVPKMGEMLFKGKSKLEILTQPGIYNAITRNLDLTPVLVARDGSKNRNYLFYGEQKKMVQNGSQEPKSKKSGYHGGTRESQEYIGMQAGALNGDPRAHIVTVFGKETMPADADKIVLISDRDDITVFSVSNATKVGNELIIDVWSSDETTTIVIGESHTYTKNGTTIYIHPNHTLFVGKKNSSLTESSNKNKASGLAVLMTTDDLDSKFVKTASFDVTYSAGSYFYDDDRLSKAELTHNLREEGYDNESITTVIKTAQEANGVPVDFNEVTLTLKAMLAELAESKHMLADLKSVLMANQRGDSEQSQKQGTQGGDTNSGRPNVAGAAAGQPMEQMGASQAGTDPAIQQIMDMAASVGADGQVILQAGQAQGMAPAQIVQQLQMEIEQQQSQSQSQPQPQGAPIEQDMAAQEQMGGQQVSGQTGDERTPDDLRQQGYNPNMTPEMLDQLQQIADKDVLNASIISYLVDTPDAKEVTGQYIEDITRGVNGLARTLLLVEIQRTSFNDQIGDKQLNTFLARGKTLLNRMTDFVIDVSIID